MLALMTQGIVLDEDSSEVDHPTIEGATADVEVERSRTHLTSTGQSLREPSSVSDTPGPSFSPTSSLIGDANGGNDEWIIVDMADGVIPISNTLTNATGPSTSSSLQINESGHFDVDMDLFMAAYSEVMDSSSSMVTESLRQYQALSQLHGAHLVE